MATPQAGTVASPSAAWSPPASKTWCSATSPRGEAPACSSIERDDDAHQDLAHSQAAPLRNDRGRDRLRRVDGRGPDRGLSAQLPERAAFVPPKLSRRVHGPVAGAGYRGPGALQRTREVVQRYAPKLGHEPCPAPASVGAADRRDRCGGAAGGQGDRTGDGAAVLGSLGLPAALAPGQGSGRGP